MSRRERANLEEMKQSQLFTKTRKEAPKDEVSKNAEFLIRAGFIHKEMAGVYSYLPLGLRVLKRIEGIIRSEINQTLGAQEVLLSALHPLENYVKTGRDKLDILFRTELAGGGEILLGQSHEEIIVPILKQYVSSYRDLPLGVYQIQTKFRNELRAKSGIMRGREFIMKDLYSFHPTEEDFNDYYERAKEVYRNIYNAVGIGDQTYLTYASGGSFSKYSHEFQTVTDSGEDTIYICKKCNVAINDEIIGDQNSCPECGAPKEELEMKKAIEVGNIFPLKTRFPDAFDFSYKDEKGEKRQIIMGCYGIGLGRLMGTVVELHVDEKGIVWPKEVAPFDLHLVALDKDNEVVSKAADKLYEELLKRGVDVLYDDRNIRTGEKFADSDLIGIPRRIVFSERGMSAGSFELVERGSGLTKMVSEKELLSL